MWNADWKDSQLDIFLHVLACSAGWDKWITYISTGNDYILFVECVSADILSKIILPI